MNPLEPGDAGSSADKYADSQRAWGIRADRDPDRRVSHGPGVLIGPGDDAAAIDITGILLSSVDVVEGVHFRRDWVEARDVGRRAVAVNVADIEAGRAVGMLAGFSSPGDLPVAWAREFADGLQTECAARAWPCSVET